MFNRLEISRHFKEVLSKKFKPVISIVNDFFVDSISRFVIELIRISEGVVGSVEYSGNGIMRSEAELIGSAGPAAHRHR